MYIRGKHAILFFLKDSEYVPFRCTTDCALTINTETKQVRTVGDGRWAKPRGQRQSYGLSMTGLIELQATDPVTFWVIENYVMQMLPIPYRLIFDDPDTSLQKLVTGQAIIKTATVNGVPVGFATSSFEMEGDGAPVITDGVLICEGTIGSISFTAGDNPGEVDVQYEGVIVEDGGRLEYAVDGGDRLPLFDPGSSGEFTVSGLAEGDHTITVWAVCANGTLGESNSVSFHIDVEGNPGAVCVPPGTITFEDVTSTSFRATWIAPDPAPAEGYDWILFEYETMTEIQSGLTVFPFQEFADMTPGVQYQFRVRSICIEGSSLSGYTSILITLVAVCNVPGTPSITSITETTATATWTAPSPAPASGYSWELLIGASVVDSGTTNSLSVDLTGLTQRTDYSFKVKAICGVGSESGFNSASFSTQESPNRIDWDFTQAGFDGEMFIYINGIESVHRTVVDTGVIFFDAGDILSVVATGGAAQLYQIIVYDNTSSTTVYSSTNTSPITMPSTGLTDTHNYNITVTISEV